MAIAEQLDLFGNVIKKHSPKMACIGVTNKTCMDRAPLDYYGTDPRAVQALLEAETFAPRVWEPTSGHGNIADTLKLYGHEVTSTDIKDYGRQDYKQDFLLAERMPKEGPMDILMNPPYKLAKEFVRHAIDLLEPKSKMGALLRIQFLEGKARYEEIYAGDPPLRVYVFRTRQSCSPKDDFGKGASNAMCFCWFVWEKGYEGEPAIRWL